MRRVLALVVALAFAVPVHANTITVSPTPVIGGDGPFTWAYDVFLDGDSTILPGDFFTIFDFAGFVPGSQSVIPGWAASAATVGACPTDGAFPVLCAAVDDPVIPNLTWTRTGAPVLGPGPDLTAWLGTFTAQSLYQHPANDFWTSQDMDNQTRTVAEGAGGNTNVPQVPEPGSLLLLGSGLALVARRRRRRA